VQRRHGADWLRHGKFNVTQGKNFDRSGSMGPFIVTADEIDSRKPVHITVKVNGEVTQDDDTASMIFSFADLIAYVTTFMTIKPADIIVAGTPVKLGPRSDPRAGSRPAISWKSPRRNWARCATPCRRNPLTTGRGARKFRHLRPLLDVLAQEGVEFRRRHRHGYCPLAVPRGR